MTHAVLAPLLSKGYQIEFHSHAEAILTFDFPDILRELATVLEPLVIPIESLIRGGGGETDTTQGLRRALTDLGWTKHKFHVQKLIDGKERESISHEVDHVRAFPGGKIAAEIEWNNKDPFFDRDLENFKRLHADAAISAGVIITRGTSLQLNLKSLIARFAREHRIKSYNDLATFGVRPTTRQRSNVQQRVNSGSRSFAEAWAEVFCADKFGQATTHWGKLTDRVRRGVGNPCPLVLIGIPDAVIGF